MTARLLEKEVLGLPLRSRLRLVKRIIESIDNRATRELKAAWDEEIEARVKEIKSGNENGISAREVMKQARRALTLI
jgi:putative addiction module component (TIGR02574 family)